MGSIRCFQCNEGYFVIERGNEHSAWVDRKTGFVPAITLYCNKCGQQAQAQIVEVVE